MNDECIDSFMNQLLANSTQNFRRVLAQAAQLAVSQGKSKIDPLHLFHGITNQAEAGITVGVFGTKKAKAAPSQAPPTSIALSPMSRRIILHAASLANAYNHSYIGTEHLLLGLIKEGFSSNKLILSHFQNITKYWDFVSNQADYQRELDRIKHLVLE